MMKKLIFLLCWKHRKCAQAVFNMGCPLCENKKCIMHNYATVTGTYPKNKDNIMCPNCGCEEYIIIIQGGKKSYICDNCHRGWKEINKNKGDIMEKQISKDYQEFTQVVRDFIRQYHLTRKWQEYIHNNEHQKIIKKIAEIADNFEEKLSE